MSTFCRITGKSKGLPKPNYFPLLPPISPADAKRFCRITGKAYGLPTHHYIPVLVGLPARKQTTFSPTQLPHETNGFTSKKRHVMLADYRYVFPCYEESNDLIQLLATKKTESTAHYVYKVAERRCSLVFTAQMEAAVRDGDIRNVMLAKDSDTLLLKLKRGIDVSVDVKEMSIEGLEVYDGEGPSEEVLSKRPKRKKAGGTDLVRKIFEDKEREAEKEFVESESKRPKMMKLSGDNNTTKEKAVTKLMAKFQNVQNFKAEDSKVVTVESSADLKSSLENVDWNKLSTDSAIPSRKPLSSTMPSPLEIHPENVNLGSSLPGIIHQPNYSLENTTGVETTAAVSPLKPLVAKPDDNVQEAIKNMSAEDLAKTSDVNAVFGEDGQKLDLLPRPEEIPEIVNNMKCGVPSVVDRDGKNVHGLKVDIESAQRLVVGVSLETASGSVFMPGQTINTPAGGVFVPGVTVRTPNGPRLIPGQVVDVDDTNGQKTPMFVAGQTLVTRDGEMFVQGQSIETPEGVKFMPGQTVLSENIPKFVPGQVTMDEEGQHRFVAGKTVSTPDGQHFIPGQMHTSATGESLFVPGQSVQTEQGWEFVPGKNMVFEEGEVKFVPGQEIKTAEGQSFVPGQFVNGDGNTTFVPGITTENEQGLKFVPGATVNTPYGQKFVEGQVYKSDSGTLSFVPGVTTAADDGSYTFAAATSLKDVVFRSDMSVGISVESVHMNGDVSDDVIYGHMVQTSQGVEFFPGVASGLPAGKVVPGRLVRGKEVKFVPGLLIDGKFVPGQVVMTDHGEQFIPGQVVETKDGPKFVPGQIIETKAGPKFVPGQTIQTEEGPKFVPGQIVETKAGPTFIPGQIISTDEEGCRFVPGQVVDTAEGPRFVPGRVVETGDRVTFIPGQVVQTSEGLKFVAPDYQDDPEGGVEFTVQGFSITPEELSLLKNRRNSKATISAASGEAAIDSRMMRQLSEAGMSIGRQVPADVPLVDVRTVPAMGIACSLADKLGLDAISTIKLSHILAAVSDLNYEIPIVGQSLENLEEIQLLQSMLKAASRADSEFSLYNEICRFLEKVLARKPDEMIEIIDKFHKFVINSELLAPLRRENKLVTLKDVVQNGTDENAVAKLTSVLSDDQAGLSSAFKHLIDGCPELVDSVVKEVSKTVNELRNEKAAADSLQRAIVNTVRESSEISVQQMLRDVEGFGLQTLLSEAVGLARALGLRDVASTLMAIMNDPNSTKLLEGDRVTLDILRRLTVMRQLAEKRPDFALALRKLQSDPELARSDPFIRELVRESGSLLILPDDAPLLQNSSDIPMSLLQNDNSLAMEDFMLRSQKHGILLIIKHGLQAVVPREAARAVLTGQVPYTVLDETGIHHFAPLHVFSALHLPPISTHRFSMYSIHTEEDAATLTPATSTDDFRKLNNPSVCTNPEQCLSEESGELIFTANQDFIADDMDALTLHRGEQVILLDTGCDPSKRLKLDPDLDLGTDVGSLLDNTAARHKISVRPRRKHADSRQRATLRDERWLVQCCDDVMRQGWVPSYILTSQNSFAEADSPTEAKYQREAVIRELVETEEEFGRDIQQVVDEYLKPLDSSSVPRIVRDNKDLIFNNLKQIADFHNTVLIEGLKYYANEPRMLGKTFLRLERDFDKHVTYCRDEPAAQDFLMENEEARDFFEELSQQLGDDKSLCEHLKLPIQRINDYQLLLKELVKYSKQLGEDTADLGKALELMLAVPHRANDNKFISNIEGYHGNIHKLGRLLRHDWFCVTDRDGKSKERYLFLFKARILICKVRRISEDRFVFVLKDIIRLPEVEVKDHIDDSKVFELHHKQPGYGGYPLTISAHKDKIKDFWLAEIRQYASDVLALAEHAADDLRLQELNEDNRNLELPAGIHIEPATPEQSIPLEPRGDSTAVKTDIFAEFQKKRDARTAKTAEDTKKVSKTSEEKVLTDSEQPLKPDSEQSQQTGNTSSKPSESTPVSEAKKLEQVVESPKPVSEPSKPVSEPPKTISEPLKPVSEPPKAVSEPPKPISEPSKSISEPPKPVTEPSKPVSEPIKPVSESPKPVSESPKPVTEPPKPVNEPSKPISEPTKPASEPTKPASELSKPVSEPPTPVSESLQPTEIKKLVTDLTEPTVKSTETVAELPKLETEPSKPTSEIQKRKSEALKPETEGQKPVSEQPKPTSEPSEPVNKLPKLEAEPSKTATELFKSTPEPQETVTEPPKSISEPPKIETDFQKPVAENPVTEPPKPTADIQKQTTTEPPKVTVEQKPTIETQKPVTPTSTVTKEVEQKPISPQPIDVPIVTEKATKDTLILSKQQLKEEELELESKQEVVGGVKRKESADSASEKKVKFEEDTEMDGYSSYSSRRSGTRHVEVEEYRSVSSSSSQEVYIETSASRQQLSSGMSTSQNMRLVEESTIINGQLVSHSQEITGGGGGYTKIQELTAGTDDVGGYTTIEEYISGSDANDVKGFASEKESTAAITEVQISDVRRRSSGPKFKKTIEGINIEPGERAVFECHLEDKAKVVWLKNNKPLEDKLADRINSLSCNDTAYRLEILGAHESDAGTYTARAVNETGDASSCSALLLVEKLAEEEKKKREESRIPWFLVRLKDTEVLENTYLRFMVKVKGYKPDVKFYKDDRLITVANERVQINKEQADVGFFELIIPDVLQEDVGIYKCIASNRYGEVECEATVTVTDDKKIFEGLEESDLLKPGEQPNFTWLRDGQPFDPEERFKVLFKDEEDSLALVFQHVKPEDAGLYTCVATTSTGKISCSAELTVQGAVHHLLREPEKPTVSTEIKKVEANINGSAMIELTVDGYPKPEVKWTKDGKEITAGSKYKILYEDEKSMSLLIKNVTIEDAGSYKVEAKNDLGIDSEEITVTVKAPPKIKKKLTDYSGMAGETIKMTVEIEGEPKPNVTWYKDGKVIIKSDHVKTYDESSTSYTLLIEKSTLDDAGSYSVVASNELSQTSEFCKVEVLSPPQFISTMTKNVISKEGETIIYQVKVQGEPKPTVKWFCYGNELKSDGTHIKITEDQQTHTLTVSGVTREDAGKYTCEISNVYGKNSDSSTLNVRCSPQFRQKLTDKVAKEGDTNVEFTVNIEAFPKPNVKWFHNETEITEKTTEYTKIEEGDNYKLIIKEVTTAMSGKYSCKVVNELGSNETSATFAVHSKPKFSKGLKDIQVDEGASLTLQIEVEGTPDPVVKWYKDGDEVTGDAHIKITRDTQRVENYSMTFTLVKSSDAGEYEVRASNEMGTAVTKSIVTVQTKTTMIQEDKIKVQEEKPVQREEEKPKPKKAAKAEVEEVSVQEIKPAEVVKTEEIKITQEAAKIEVEQPQKIVETETLTPKKSVEEEIITVQEKAEVQIEPPKKLETVEKKEKSPKKAIKIEKPEEIIEEPPSLPQKISVKSEEKTPEQASIIEKPEEIIQEPPSLPQKISVKSEENVPEQAKKIGKPEEIIQEPPSLPQKISVKSEENVPEQAKKIEKPDEIIEEVPSLPQKASTKQPETPKTAEINAAPEIISADMNDRTIYESLGAKFEIQAKGVPRPEAKWYKDGEELKSSDHIKITEENDKYRLEITKAKMTDAGNYKCKVVNKMGEKAQSAKLSITAETALREPKIKVPLKDQSVPKNEEATMTIILTADPIPEVRWTHDDKDISETYILSSESKEIEDGLKEVTYTLKIPKGCHQDTGVYQFVAKNKFGTAESSARLDIVFKPEITCFKDVVTVPFSNSEMVANILANPRPDIKWSAGGKAVDIDGEHYVTENDTINEVYKLLINGSSINDENTYIVTASNKIGESSAQARFSVHTEPPSILKGIENHSLKDYEPFEFKIRANGIPKPQIIWLKDREEIQPNFRVNIETSDEGQVSSCLSIPHFSEDDVGKYTVKAVSMAGEAESSAKLRMTQIPPSFLKALPRSAEVGEGEPLELKAKLDGSPIPKVKWFKDGAPLVADDHVKIVNSPDGSIKLQIDSVKPTDCGAYKVIAVNPNGESTSICAVAVTPTPRRPSFSKELSDANVTEGEPLRLEAQVMAFPAPEVKWFKDGHPVRPSPGVSFINSPGGLVGLVVDKMRPEDAGTYTLTVANKLGDISSTAKVGVSVKEKKPQFLSQLMPANVVEGFPAKMEIKVSGHPLPQIAWTLNGKPIVPDGEHIKIVDGPDGSQCLVIDKATPEDAGVYAVVAKNSQGEITSQAPLHVATKGRSDIPQEPPSFPKGLRDTTADEETPLTFSAPFLGNPIPDVVWSKDGVPLQASERVQFTCDGNKVGLEINPSKVSDVGVYSCQLKNPLGEAESQAKATVRKIYQKPQFTQRFSDLQQLPTFDAKFFARVTGNPKPEISWYKDGNIIKESPKYRMKRDGDTVCLYVQDCTPEDSGIYRCIASNKEGQDTCDAQLQVVDKIEKPQRKEAPAFLKKIGDCEIFKGMTAKFTACATGYPEPEVEWYKGDEKLYPSERIKMEQEGTGLLRLLISGVDPQIDVGKYRCRIFNPYGEDSCEANILCDILDVKPRKPVGDQYTDYDKFRSTGAPLPLADRPIISRMTDRRLTLSWKPSIPIGPRDPVTYHVEMCELPNGDWFTARTGVRSCACDISNLEPFRDYKFRIRVENKYGISDPSPFAQTYREKLLPDPPKFVPYLPPGIDFRPETSPYFPKDFDIERPPHDGYAQAPRFLHQEHDTQYGVKGHNCNLFWFVYGYPKPKMQYFFNDEPIEMGGRYDSSYTRNGQATLFINKMLDRDVGVYEAVATNEHGEARQRVRLEIAEYPEFIKRPNETIIMIRRSGRLEARVTGVPPPEIKWYKDWQPLAQSSRIKMQHIEPDVYILVINDVILKDEGLYSISARNIAGSISSSVMIRVEENEADYSYHTYDKGRSVKPRTNKTLEDLYDLGDELGRGTQGITYHAVERLSGRNYAAKMMHGKGELRAYMRNELEIMNLLNHRKLIRLHDAFETPDSFMLITELAGGGELLDTLTKQTFTTESEIAGYIRQILLGLEHMHDLNIAHLGLTPGDLLISHAGGDDLKICDFGLARRIAYGKLAALDFGMPEYVAPEIINGEGVSFSADMWAVGIITHLLLTGISIFRSVDDRTTLTNIKEDRWEFNEDIWKNLSSEARDFIRQLVVHQPARRMDVKAALKHPWLTFADKIPSDQYQITTDTLRNYCNLYKDWYSNASCRLWYRRRPLIGAFSHPSRMVYPPGHVYTPEPSPEPRRSKDYSPHIRTWEDRIPSREPIDYELGVVKSESHYQNGPDTYLLQLRDVDFPVRLREYMKVAANRAPGYSRQVSDQHHLDWKAPVIRERRRFTDVMDEEIDDERRARINKYGNADLQTMRRLKHEIGTRLDTHVEADALMEAKRDGHAPFFREKPQILPIVEDQNAQLVCYAVGDPNPTVQWFKNDLVVTESHRLKIIEDDTGRSILSFSPAASFDIGIYKVVARNKIGQVIARTRVVLAQPPDAPDSPDASDISDTEVLLRWKQPKEDGNSPVVCYSLQYKEADAVDWKDVASNIDHEFFVIRGLRPNIAYQFRLSARNKIGWSEKGIPTKPIKTKAEGAPKVQVTKAMKHLQSLCEAGQEIVIEEVKHPLDYSIERNRIEWSNEIPTEKYNFISEIARGRYSVVVKGIDKANDQVIVAKVLDYRPDTEAQVNQEFEVLRSLRHERIAALTHTFKPGNTPVAVFILEKLQGADILTYLSSRHEYTEQMVATVVTQVLDALQYLHWRGYCHLNLEPDNIVMASVRSIQIKLVDFGAAQHVSKLGTMVHVKTNPEYTAPEILSDEPAFPQSDIWSVGVLTYILLSGVSPFKGATKEETKQNITFVRYRFEHLYKELTQEATRFIMLLFKRAPTKRPTVEECHETRWLLPTEFMIKKRERAVFLGNRLKEVSDAYHSEKAQEVTKCDSLVSALGGRAPITRSNSIQEELLTTV